MRSAKTAGGQRTFAQDAAACMLREYDSVARLSGLGLRPSHSRVVAATATAMSQEGVSRGNFGLNSPTTVRQSGKFNSTANIAVCIICGG
jgi:hypothetical protein